MRPYFDRDGSLLKLLLTTAADAVRQVMRELSISRDMVRQWRQRWVDLQPIALADLSIAERLADLPRPGVPARITADQVRQIQQMACEKLEESGRPISHWTNREVAQEVINRGIVEQISPATRRGC
jgi:putative transposase